jgi:hypothetical protein
MQTILKTKDNLTLTPTYLEVFLDHLPLTINYDAFYRELCEYPEILFHPILHDTWFYENYFKWVLPRLLYEGIIVNIVVPVSVVSYVVDFSFNRIIVHGSIVDITKGIRHLTNLSKVDVVLIDKFIEDKQLEDKQINLVKKVLSDHKIPVTLAVSEGVLSPKCMLKHNIYSSRILDVV